MSTTPQPARLSVPPLTGYFDRISVRPGERIALKASSKLPGRVATEVVRIGYADKNPDGPGMNLQPWPGLVPGDFAARHQPVALGSWGKAPATGLFDGAVVCLQLRCQPWLVRDAGAALLALAGPDGAAAWALVLTPAGLTLEAGGKVVAQAAFRPRRKKWYDLSVRFDLRSATVTLDVSALDGQQSASAVGQAQWTPPADAQLYFAAEPTAGGMIRHLNGRLEDICLRAGDAGGPVLAFWDFSLAMQGVAIIDTGPRGLHGQLINLPTRAVRGSLWDGTEQSFQHAPRQYAAIHFHEDDIYDAGWQTDLELLIPDDMPSGIYGLRLTQGPAQDIVPFYVLAPRGKPRSRICYLAASFTYQAYGNHARNNLDAAMEQRITDWDTPRGPDNYPGFGFSTYNFHPDGSGTCYSSRLRPLLTMRPGFVTFAIHEGSGLRHFPADGHLTEWFDRKGLPFDVVTDEDLHREGATAIAGYDVVITGSHPEYHTTQSLDALRDYSAAGGNFIYLGGNGFYWRIAASDALPGVIEVRRAEGGIRAWATEPGEGYQVLDGQYGGLWRRNGRAPQEIGGVGFSAQGLFEGSYYRRTECATLAEHAWVFDGVTEDLLGDYGYSGGGAAGFELDRADQTLGSPENTVVLARSEGHGPSFMVVPEEVLSHIATVSGEPPKDLVRAEIVHARLPGGGQIFATGSITFCGSLPWNDFNNGVSRMLENVVRRFAGLDK